MANSALKMLVQKAKKRLTSAGKIIADSNNDKNFVAYLSSSGSYAIIANKQSLEDDPLYAKVKKIVESEDIQNPLAVLTDKSVFNNLNDLDKERYIIDISKRYNELKDYFLSQK